MSASVEMCSRTGVCSGTLFVYSVCVCVCVCMRVCVCVLEGRGASVCVGSVCGKCGHNYIYLNASRGRPFCASGEVN